MTRKRPQIPWRVVLAVAIRQAGGSIPCAETGEPMTAADAMQFRIERDHVPPLSQRDYDPETGDYSPPANAPGHIDLVSKTGHAIRTNKRRGLKRGDQTELAHRRKLDAIEAAHREAMEHKINPPVFCSDQEAGPMPGTPMRHWPLKGTRKIKSRGFDKRFRRKMDGTVEKRDD